MYVLINVWSWIFTARCLKSKDQLAESAKREPDKFCNFCKKMCICQVFQDFTVNWKCFLFSNSKNRSPWLTSTLFLKKETSQSTIDCSRILSGPLHQCLKLSSGAQSNAVLINSSGLLKICSDEKLHYQGQSGEGSVCLGMVWFHLSWGEWGNEHCWWVGMNWNGVWSVGHWSCLLVGYMPWFWRICVIFLCFECIPCSFCWVS